MKNWKNLFDDIILMRGYDYYLDDAVDDIREIDDGFEAIVHGSYDYTVTIGVDDGDVTYMECDCPYAEGGENCKHEAALLYELSAEGRLARTSFSSSLYSEGENDSEKILNTLNIEDLRAFLLDEIKCYPGIREHFIVAFANTLPKEYAVVLEKEAERYINLINDYDEEEADYFFEDRSGSAIDDDVLARLLTFPNVLVTSHQAFFTREAVNNIAEITLGNIRDFELGRPLVNSICPDCALHKA